MIDTLMDRPTDKLCHGERKLWCSIIIQAVEDLAKPFGHEDCSYRWWTDPVNDIRTFALSLVGVPLAAIRRTHADLFEQRRQEAEEYSKRAKEIEAAAIARADKAEKAKAKREEDERIAKEKAEEKAEQNRQRIAQKAEIKRKMEEMKAQLKALD